MLGAVIGGHRLVAQLGEGGMGAVYLAEHLLLGRRAAVKVLLPALSARPEIVQRFFNEARAVTAIADPGIVQVFDFGYHTDGSAFLVMELLEGEPLDARLRRNGRLLAVDALRIGRQLASSLAAAHARGIVHRDLKPENVFLVGDAEVAGGERVKILDFGIAKLSEEAPRGQRTMAGVLMGTPAYMSPEQCRGAVELDHRSDIYALGCVLFHLVVGRPPFIADGVGDIIASHLRTPAIAPSLFVGGVMPEVDAIVLRCLAKAPAERFASMADLAAAIAAVLTRLAPGPLSGAHAVPYLAGATPPPAAAAPTTLGGSAAAVARAPAGRGRAVATLVVAALAVAAVAIGLRPGGDQAAPAAVAVDDAVAAAAIDAAIDAGVDATVDAMPDAGEADAAAAIDAGPRRMNRRAPPADARCSRCDLDCDGIPEERGC
jgi:tRNA A-37 threonylcarbamoyl transferase component Bud32